MKKILSLMALTACVSTVVGCQAPPPQAFMPRQAPGFFQQRAMRGPVMPGFRSFSDVASEGQLFSAHFVKAYGETIAENEPLTRNDPDGPAQVLFRMIQQARRTLDGSFYDIGDHGFVDALIEAKRRGVQVRIITDNKAMLDDEGNGIRDTILKLQQAGIPLVDDQRSGIMHNKFMIVDGQAVWMGSTNATSTSMYNHNNNALVVRNQQVAENYQYEFDRMFIHKTFGTRPARQVPHPVIKVGNSTIRTFFSPRGGGQEAVVETVAKAQQRLSFMTFSFTDKQIAGIMVDKKKAGLRVEGVFDQCLGYGRYSMYHTLRKNNIYTRMDGNEALLHHKVILVDDTVITGSYNFSNNADRSNNENMLIIENSYVSAMYKKEYDRVMTAAKNNRPPKNKCPGRDD